jgi:hypothetical protein
VNAGHALNGADGIALTEHSNGCDFLFSGEDVRHKFPLLTLCLTEIRLSARLFVKQNENWTPPVIGIREKGSNHWGSNAPRGEGAARTGSIKIEPKTFRVDAKCSRRERFSPAKMTHQRIMIV